MLKRPNKLLIGKDINRTAAVTAATEFATVVANIADGEVVVLDQNKNPLAAGSTIADSEVIFICQGTGLLFDYTGETGVAVTGARKVIFSDPIEGKLVKSYKGLSYAVKVEQVTSFVLTGLTVVPGVSYVMRIVYSDINEHPGQFTQTYRFIATDALVDTLGAGIAAAINRHKDRRVTAAYVAGTDTLTLTGRAIPEATTSLTNIDEFSMVQFDAFFNYVNASGNWTNFVDGTTVEAEYGVGNWQQIRDLEKDAWGYRGIGNITKFPVIVPAFDTLTTGFYDMIVIEHDKSYLSPDNSYVKETALTTVIALGTATNGVNAGTQKADIVAVLNPWMASLPLSFANVTI
jgi:hypothetical protein